MIWEPLDQTHEMIRHGEWEGKTKLNLQKVNNNLSFFSTYNLDVIYRLFDKTGHEKV